MLSYSIFNDFGKVVLPVGHTCGLKKAKSVIIDLSLGTSIVHFSLFSDSRISEFSESFAKVPPKNTKIFPLHISYTNEFILNHFIWSQATFLTGFLFPLPSVARWLIYLNTNDRNILQDVLAFLSKSLLHNLHKHLGFSLNQENNRNNLVSSFQDACISSQLLYGKYYKISKESLPFI